MKQLKIFFLYLLLLSLSAVAQTEAEEDQSYSAKPNLISRSRVEIIGGSTTGGFKLGVNYVVTPRLLVGLFNQNMSQLDHSEGGDLDNGQYYKTTSGFSGKAALLTAKYFLNEKGIESKGWFLSGQLGRSWGKYELSQERYERDNGFIGSTFLGIDKKLAETSDIQQTADSDIARASVGYAIPWIDGNLLKGISLQVHGGLEANSLPNNQYLSNKFTTRNVGEDVKKTIFAEIALGAYF